MYFCCSSIRDLFVSSSMNGNGLYKMSHIESPQACIFDNTGDGDFYTSSQNLDDTWTQLGNKAETHFLDGGHCQIHSFDDIIDCLDDGTGRLKNMNTNCVELHCDDIHGKLAEKVRCAFWRFLQ